MALCNGGGAAGFCRDVIRWFRFNLSISRYLTDFGKILRFKTFLLHSFDVEYAYIHKCMLIKISKTFAQEWLNNQTTKKHHSKYIFDLVGHAQGTRRSTFQYWDAINRSPTVLQQKKMEVQLYTTTLVGNLVVSGLMHLRFVLFLSTSIFAHPPDSRSFYFREL